MKIDHVQLAIPPESEEAQRPFWIEGLGFDEVEKPQELQGRGGLWLTHGSTNVHLGVEKDHQPALKAHPAFLTPDLDLIAKRLQALKHPPQWDTSLPTVRRFFVSDPAGNRIEIMEDT